jgi:lipopolysaccharide/colanic/teichoic acid biosynthesis glycosyltransferase
MKRIFDFIIALVLLTLLLPLLILISILVNLFIGKPVFYIQQRPGLNCKIFKMVKFRTMLDRFDSSGNILSDEIRLTGFGKFLRSSSLDELPELWNVLKGDMSLVGPRPLLVEYIPLYSGQHSRRHNVKPGITGWAQINGRNSISWEDKFDLDIWYVDNYSFWIDLKILYTTIFKVLGRKDINNNENVTMTKFKGN